MQFNIGDADFHARDVHCRICEMCILVDEMHTFMSEMCIAMCEMCILDGEMHIFISPDVLVQI